MTRDLGKGVKLMIVSILSSVMCVKFSDMQHPLQGFPAIYSHPATPESFVTYCLSNNNWSKCPEVSNYWTYFKKDFYKDTLGTNHEVKPLEYTAEAMFKTTFHVKPYVAQKTVLRPFDINLELTQTSAYVGYSHLSKVNSGIKVTSPYDKETDLDTNQLTTLGVQPKSTTTSINITCAQSPKTPSLATGMNITKSSNNIRAENDFTEGLHRFERNFYMTTFKKLLSISPEDRKENGMSFVQSGLLLYLTLMGLSTEADVNTKAEIENCIGYRHSDLEKIELIRRVMSSLPNSSDEVKFKRSSRLLFGSEYSNRDVFDGEAFNALDLHVDIINTTQDASDIANVLNHMVEADSGGSIHKTFEENELSEAIRAILLMTVYFRASWQSAPTVLNGTRTFHGFNGASNRSVRMIRINDHMKYADLKEWDAEAIEIGYAKPGLSFLMIVPRGRSLRNLTNIVGEEHNLKHIIHLMKNVRIAATLPLYTLRMTLLLPNKLQAMGISRLLDTTDTSDKHSLRLSHGVQRLMFWSEAGRHAFKDDGIEWDEHPEMEIFVDRPYIFFVRWHNLTLINGNFVL